MGSFWRNFTASRTGERKQGLGRWFQILEDRFMTLFWGNLLCMAFALPFLIGLFFFTQTGDYLSLLGMVLGLVVMGPGITALDYLTMQVIRDKHVYVWEDFLKSLRRDWKQSVLYALLMGTLWGAFAYALRLILVIQGGLGPMYTAVFALNAFLVMGLTVIGFQQIAMVRLPFYGVVKNAFLLIFAGKGRAFGAILFALGAVCACLWFYEYFVFILLLGAPVLILMTANLILLPVFEEFFPEEEG